MNVQSDLCLCELQIGTADFLMMWLILFIDCMMKHKLYSNFHFLALLSGLSVSVLGNSWH